MCVQNILVRIWPWEDVWLSLPLKYCVLLIEGMFNTSSVLVLFTFLLLFYVKIYKHIYASLNNGDAF